MQRRTHFSGDKTKAHAFHRKLRALEPTATGRTIRTRWFISLNRAKAPLLIPNNPRQFGYADAWSEPRRAGFRLLTTQYLGMR